jgi:hypothetical protein
MDHNPEIARHGHRHPVRRRSIDVSDLRSSRTLAASAGGPSTAAAADPSTGAVPFPSILGLASSEDRPVFGLH